MKWKEVDIDINDPSAVLNLYSSRLYKSEDWECLTLEQLEFVFIHILSDFYDHGISIDVLISVAEFISDQFHGEGDSELMGVIIPLGDLDYYLRKVTDKDNTGNFIIGTLRDLHIYFEKNKHLLKK